MTLTSDILISNIGETIAEIQKNLEDVDNLNFESISQIYFQFIQVLKSSQYLSRMAECFKEYRKSKNHPINKLELESIEPELKTKIADYISKIDENQFKNELLFNSTNGSIEKVNNTSNEVEKYFHQANINNMPNILKLSLRQFEIMLKLKTIIQKLLYLEPFFDLNNNNFTFNSPNLSENVESHHEEKESNKIIRLESKLETVSNSLQNVLTDNSNLKMVIERLKAENDEYKIQMKSLHKLRRFKIIISEQNTLLRKDNERLREELFPNSEPPKFLLTPNDIQRELGIDSNMNSILNEQPEDVNVKDIEDKMKLEYEQKLKDELEKRDVELSKLIQLITRMKNSFEKIKSFQEP